MMRTGAVIAFILLFTAVLPAQRTPQELYNEGAEAYRQGEFAQAAALYRTLCDTFGIRHADIYYNLGNCLFREGRIGLAIVNYERARRLQPRDDDINRNLAFARMAIKDRLPGASHFILMRWAIELLAGFSCNELFWGASAAFLLLSLVLARGIIAGFNRAGLLRALTVTIMVFAVSAGMAGAKAYIEHGLVHGVVTAPKTEIYSGPDTKYTLRFILHEGTGAVVERVQDGWMLIRLENGEKGWLRATDLQRI